MALRACVLAMLILLLATAVCNCCGCLDWVGLSKLNHPRQWYNVSYDPSDAPDITINIKAMTIGDTPIQVLDSSSGRINLSIFYYYEPKFAGYRGSNGYNIDVTTDYNDWAQGVGADIFVYLPRNANYTLNIRSMAASNDSIYKDGSPLLVNYTGGSLTVWLNDPAHPVPL